MVQASDGSVILFLAMAHEYSSLTIFADALFIAAIVALIVINLKSLILPNIITLPGIVIALLLRLVLPMGEPHLQWLDFSMWLPAPAASLAFGIAGAIIGGGALWIVRLGWAQMRGVEILAFGDIKMMCMIGAYLGIARTLLVLALILCVMLPLTLVVFQSLRRRRDSLLLPSGFIWGVPAIIVTVLGGAVLAWLTNQ